VSVGGGDNSLLDMTMLTESPSFETKGLLRHGHDVHGSNTKDLSVKKMTSGGMKEDFTWLSFEQKHARAQTMRVEIER